MFNNLSKITNRNVFFFKHWIEAQRNESALMVQFEQKNDTSTHLGVKFGISKAEKIELQV